MVILSYSVHCHLAAFASRCFLLVWVNLVNYPKAPVISVRSWYDVTVSLPLKLTPVFFEMGCSRSCWLRRFYWQKCPLELERNARVASGSGPGYLDVINWFGGSVDCRKPRRESLPSWHLVEACVRAVVEALVVASLSICGEELYVPALRHLAGHSQWNPGCLLDDERDVV